MTTGHKLYGIGKALGIAGGILGTLLALYVFAIFLFWAMGAALDHFGSPPAGAGTAVVVMLASTILATVAAIVSHRWPLATALVMLLSAIAIWPAPHILGELSVLKTLIFMVPPTGLLTVASLLITVASIRDRQRDTGQQLLSVALAAVLLAPVMSLAYDAYREREREKRGTAEVLWYGRYNHRVQKFSSTGEFLTKWGTYGSGKGQFKDPRDIAVDEAGNVYVVDLSNRVQKFTSDGKYLAQWGRKGQRDGQFYFPIRIAVDKWGNVYVLDVLDWGNSRVEKFGGDGEFLLSFRVGSPSPGPYGGLAVDETGNIYVGHGSNVGVYASDGSLLGEWRVAQGQEVQGIAVDPLGNVYVGTARGSASGMLRRFSRSGTELELYISRAPHAPIPSDIALSSAGNIYVADWVYSQIQVFDRDGRFLTKWGSRGIGDGQFYRLFGIAIDGSGNVYVTF